MAAILAVALTLAGAAGARTSADPLTIYAAASLTEVFKALRPGAEVQLRGLERARDADQARRAGGHLRVGGTAQHAAAVRGGHRRQAGHVHGEPARVDRAEVEPGRTHSVYDLKSKNVKLVIANAAVPVGGYTRTVLKKMGLSSVLSKVVSQESDVKAVTGKVALGQADAGFVYVTDARQ